MLTLAIVNDLNLQGIKIFEKEFKISQFADNTAIFLKDKGMVDRETAVLTSDLRGGFASLQNDVIRARTPFQSGSEFSVFD